MDVLYTTIIGACERDSVPDNRLAAECRLEEGV